MLERELLWSDEFSSYGAPNLKSYVINAPNVAKRLRALNDSSVSLLQSMVYAVGKNKRSKVAESAGDAQSIPWIGRKRERPKLINKGPQAGAYHVTPTCGD